MKDIFKIMAFFAVLIIWTGCEKEELFQDNTIDTRALKITEDFYANVSNIATGSVTVRYYPQQGEGGEGGEHFSDYSNLGFTEQGEEAKTAMVSFDAHSPTYKRPAKGKFYLTMLSKKGEIKREIIAKLHQVEIDPESSEGWFIGTVIFDDGCGGEGGCGGGDHLLGIVDHDGEEGDHDPKGGKCRDGQEIKIYVYDGGTPGINGDIIGWRWAGKGHGGETGGNDWSNIHEKTIVEGNLVVHK